MMFLKPLVYWKEFLYFIYVDLFNASLQLKGIRKSLQYLSSIGNAGLTNKNIRIRF